MNILGGLEQLFIIILASMKTLCVLVLLCLGANVMAQERGYRAHVEFGPAMTISGMEKTAFGGAIYTSHGYQFCPEFFVGGGVGAFGFLENEDGEPGGIGGTPLYLNLQSYLTNGKVAPFVDLKIGYALFDYDGLYLAPTVGVRVVRKEWMALRVGLNYSRIGVQESYMNAEGGRSTDRWYLQWLGLHVGLTFGGNKYK